MAEIMYDLSVQAVQNNMEWLKENPYPGRGIVMGISSNGEEAQQVYWVMGRSSNSQNRILEVVPDVTINESGTYGSKVQTAPFDESKVEDPSLIIYNAMRNYRGIHFVSNGDQTDDMINAFYSEEGFSVFEALLNRVYEPDGPNYTPRISGTMQQNRGGDPHYMQSIIVRRPGLVEEEMRAKHIFYRGILDEDYGNGRGACMHTYMGDGEPLPSFDIDPYPTEMGSSAEETAETYWECLNPDNRVAIVVKSVSLAKGGLIRYAIINRHKGEKVEITEEHKV